MPPIPIEYRNLSGNTSSEASAPATVSELYSTVRPAVCSVRAIAARESRPTASSSRKRESTNRL